MEILCFILVLSGAVVMGYSILEYNKVLRYMKTQTYEYNIFHNWIYVASFIMMLFFMVGYLVFAFTIFINVYNHNYLLVSFIFFFGAIFVLFMVNVQKTMSKTIVNMLNETIQSMIYSMEAKDFYTKGHSDHVSKLAELLYEHLPETLKRKIDFVKLKDAAMLHDIGKIGIPDGILNKPGRLTEDEYEIIRQHPENGRKILEKTAYRDICDIILYHHERIDGEGYYKIPENAVPPESKIISVADTFSALYTDRVYRKKLTFEKAISVLKEIAGTQLDKTLVAVFSNIPEYEIDKISI
jgi:HD-GYP domain-containing protein (c-di-GMP phosphodiesterase class II)